MAFSKITFNGETLMDVTQDTVTAANLLSGIIATGANGSSVTGSIATNSAADLIASGPTVSVPSGYYGTEVNKTVKTVALDSGVDIPFLATISINSQTGLITVSQGSTTTTYPISASGYVEKTPYEIKISGSSSLQLSTQAAATIIPTESSQTAVASGKYTLGPVTVAAIPSDYIGSNITTLAATTYTPSSATQTIPSSVYLTGAQTIAGDTALVASNIIQGATIFGVVGTAKTQPTLQSKTVTPSSTSQVITFDSGYDGLSSVTIDAIPISVINHRLVLPDGLIGV